MLPVFLPALHTFPFCNQLRPRFSRVYELIPSQPVRTAVWRGHGTPWRVVCRVSSSWIRQGKKVSNVSARPAPSPCYLRKSGHWWPKALGFPGHTKKCPWAVLMTWTVSGIPGPSSVAETYCGTGAFQVLHVFPAVLGTGWLYFWKASVEFYCPSVSMLQNHVGNPSLPHDGLV